MEFLAYLVAPAIAILMDKMYYGSMKNIIFGFFPVKKKYVYSDFSNFRIIGTVVSSFIITYAGINEDLLVGMIGAAIFLISHIMIYIVLYYRERHTR